jgi:hypothetical protein
VVRHTEYAELLGATTDTDKWLHGRWDPIGEIIPDFYGKKKNFLPRLPT